MRTTEIGVRRLCVISPKSFDEVVSALQSTIGRPDMSAFRRAVAASTLTELEHVVHNAVGSSGLMEFARFDAGAILRKEIGSRAPRILRLLAGNPLIMKEMAKTVPDAAAYAPVTILIYERPNGVHLSYDSMASLLAPSADSHALAVAEALDSKIQRLLETAAQ